MATSASAVPSLRLQRLGLAALGLTAIATFALAGESPAGRGAAAALAILILLLAARRVPGRWSLAVLPLALLVPNRGGWQLFDVVVVGLVLAAIGRTLAERDRTAFDVRGPGFLALALITAPLLALPGVDAVSSFLGGYKELLAYALLFLGLRRLVPRAHATTLLWAFPVLGLAVTAQLLAKTDGVVGVIGRVGFRNFYTDLGWGQSNAIAAVLLVCICGTCLLAAVERRALVRVGLLAGTALMLHAILIPSSRSATVALAVFVLILVVRMAGGMRIVALILGGMFVLVGLSQSTGRLLLNRFTDPREYASWVERQSLWATAWSRFIEHPLVGTGLNQGRQQADYMGEARAHSLVLDTLMEQGIVGLIVLVTIVVAIVRLCLRMHPTGRAATDARIRTIAIAMVVSILLQSLVEPTLLAYPITVPCVFFLAWLTLQDPQGATPRAGEFPTAGETVPAAT